MIQAMRLLVHPYGNWKAQAYAKLGYATLLFIFRKAAAALGLYPTLPAGIEAAADASSRTPSANNFLAVFVYAMFPHLPFPLPTRCSPLFPATQAAAAAADSMTSALTRPSAQLLLAVLEWHAIGITSMQGMAR
jgi:hypothetical protein